MNEGTLGAEAFRALAAVGWADGQIQAGEAEAIERAAKDEGLTGEALAAVTAALKTRVQIKDLDLKQLVAAEKLHVYAMSSWIASAQDGVGLRERIALNDMGKLLELTQKERDAMDAAVAELLAKPEGKKPGKFDLNALRQSLDTRVQAVRDAAVKKT